jgi:hypothetical protein
MTRRVLEAALETEMAEHLGYDKGDPAGRGVSNSRNGPSVKTAHTDIGPVTVKVPRDTAGEFELRSPPTTIRPGHLQALPTHRTRSTKGPFRPSLARYSTRSPEFRKQHPYRPPLP